MPPTSREHPGVDLDVIAERYRATDPDVVALVDLVRSERLASDASATWRLYRATFLSSVSAVTSHGGPMLLPPQIREIYQRRRSGEPVRDIVEDYPALQAWQVRAIAGEALNPDTAPA